MFFRLGLVVLLLPSLYVYLRLLPLFSNRRHKIFFTLFLLSLIVASLGTELLSHSQYGDSANTLLMTAYCSLPFLLYLFLLVLLRDILLGMNQLFTFISPDALRSASLRTTTLWLLIPTTSPSSRSTHSAEYMNTTFHSLGRQSRRS